MRVFSSGELANLLGVHRDAVQVAIRAGAPDSTLRAGRKRIFTEADAVAMRRWFVNNGRKVNEICFASASV